MFEIAVVNEPSVFESLKFYCNFIIQADKMEGHIEILNVFLQIHVEAHLE